ncbi:putative Protein polybromo-1 [Hypsibius exemplaris]|uniref:HMG box domain-containing protein n=1 Tax=Hypsibius exemplaris TaxID=2072580 RepID=A0A1W0X5J0_HYPEX|nr:putative Protein polybromo-1 [Hypsibius exemplaris]
MPENQRIQLIPRETLLPAVRVPSVFASLSAKDGSMKPDSWSATTGPPGFPLCKDSEIIDVIREPVLAKSAVPEEGVLAYEQKDSPVGFIKIGDCFSVKGESADRIIKVEKIFDKGPETFVSGIIFVFTKDLPPTIALPAKLFYHNEVFQKVTEETLSVKQLATRCAVLSLRDFSSCRQTELTEDQVYIVESKILENGTAGRRTKGSRLLNVSAAGSSHATDDEIFFFEKPVDPRRVVSPFLEPVLSGKVVEIDRTPEESPVGTISYDDDALSISHASEISFATPLSPAASNYDGSGKKRSRSGKKLHKKGKYTVSGFILYGADNRRAIKDNHPGLSFQETSRHVSDMWRALTTGERKKWEDEAKRKSNFVNSEMKSRGYSHLDGISFKGLGSKNDMDLIVELERRAQQQEAHLKDEAAKAAAAREATQAAQTQAAAAAAAAHAASLPSTSGMSNHQTQQSQSQPPSSMTAPGSPIKTNEAGGQGQTGTVQMISPQALAMMQSQHQQYQRIIQQQQMQIQQQQQVQRPLFLTLPSEPPKVKRALHSEVFLKYLENNGMGSHPKPDVPYWRRQLAASQDTIPPPRQIPDYWPSLLNIDAETKNKGMEMVSRMWSTRNLIFTKTCGLVPVPLTQSTGGGPSSSNSTAGPSSKPFSPPIALPVMARERSSARRPPSSRR